MSDNFNGICLQNVEANLKWEYDYDQSRASIPGQFPAIITGEIEIKTSTFCGEKDRNNNFHNKRKDSVNSEAENSNYSNASTSSKGTPGSSKFNFKVSGRWFLEKICEICCSKPGGGSRIIFENVEKFFTGDEDESPIDALKNLKRVTSGSIRNAYLSYPHAFLRRQNGPLPNKLESNILTDMFTLINDTVNGNASNSSNLSKSIDDNLKNFLNCNGSETLCPSCKDATASHNVDSDRDFNVITYEDILLRENNFREMSFNQDIINPQIKFNLLLSMDKAWINN